MVATDPAPSAPSALELLVPGALSGRTALVTGAGSGIGRATARTLGHLGVRVALVGRRAEALQETAEQLRAAGCPEPLILPADLREPEEVDAMLDDLLAATQNLDYLVNNAGGQFIAPAESVSYNGFRAVTRLNFDAVWYLTTRVAGRAMLAAGYGKVVSITMTPRRGMPGMAHSSAARAAVENLTSTLSQEWAPRGIRLAAVAPGIVHTEGWSRNYGLDPDVVAKVIPAGRLQQPEEVAAVVAFLLSPLGDYITGITIEADGGYSGLGPANALQAALATAAPQR